MNTAIPRMALLLGLAGLIPFGYSALVTLRPELTYVDFGARDVALGYGFAIFCFMAGALWGFAAKSASRAAGLGYVLAVAPLLALLGVVALGYATLLEALLAGFPALLPLDAFFTWRGMAPRWWLNLRLLLTAGVVIFLGVVTYG